MAVLSSRASARLTRARSGAAALLLATLLTLLIGATASAAPPAVTLDKQAPERQLFGTDAEVTLHASNPTGQPYGYNLSFRDVLPAGVSYVPGSAPIAPRILTDAPALGQTTLLWENVADLSPNSSFDLSYKVRHSRTTLDAGDTYVNSAGAYLHEDARFIPKFNANGTPIAEAGVGAATDTVETLLTAVEVEKDEPSPEGELLRGAHDHKTVYTITVRNNEVNPTTGVTLDDWLPAGLEYLACATDDNTTDAGAGSPLEYPGAPPLDAGSPPAPDCRAPSLVETVLADPDAGGPLPTAVYTHVRWTGLPDLAPGSVQRVQYIAAIPIFENTLDFGALPPSPASGGQAANLDNNDGTETADEQALTNYARASGTYAGSTVVWDDDTLTRTAEDIAMQKGVSTGTIQQGGISTWTLALQASEYRSVANIRITDVLPDGLCPLGDVNFESGTPSSTECDPVAGQTPSLDYAGVTERTDGAFELTWNAPDLAPNETATITFPTRARTHYQEAFLDADPILTRDAWTNQVSLLGADSTPPGVPHTEPDGSDDVDVSSAHQEAGSLTIDKTIRQPDGSVDCNTGTYSDAVAQTYGPGDRVCYRLKVTFPGPLDTGEPDVVDFLPPGTSYEPGSMQLLETPGDATVTFDDNGGAGPLTWELRNPTGDVQSGGQVFEAQIAGIVGSPAGPVAGDILANLQKVSFSNTSGTTFPLRDQADFEYAEAELDLVKGLQQVNSGPVLGRDVDGQLVGGGDVVTYRLDLDELGGIAAEQAEVWDLLPTGIACSDVSAISDGGTCDAGNGRIVWTGIDVAADGTRKLTYNVTIPGTFGPQATLVNRAGVRGYQSTSNLGTTTSYVPGSNIDPTQGPGNAPAADDDADVQLRGVTIDKTHTTEVTETGNNAASQATIGEEIDYEISTTIPSGTTLYGTPALTDPLGAQQTFKPGSLTATLNGADITSDISYTISTTGNTISVTLPTPYVNASGDDVLVVAFTAQVADVAANVRGASLPNTASFGFTDAASGGTVRSVTDTVHTTIVEPLLRVTKAEDDADDRVVPGQDINYTVTASHAAGSNVAPAHDVQLVDVVPAGLTPDTGSISGSGVWNPGARTITWTVTTLVPGTPVTRTYVARVDNPATAATTFQNTVTLTGTSLDAAHETEGERTAGSVTNVDYRSTASRTVRIAAAVVDKTVSPGITTVGDRLTFTVDLTLRANVGYPDVALLDTLPDGIDFDATESVTCVGGCGLTATQLPSAPQGDGSTQLGWWIGDAGSAGADRVVRIVYRGHVDDRREPEATPVVAGQTYSNSVQAGYNSVDRVSGTPGSIPAVASFDESSTPDTAVVTVAEPAITIDKDVSGDPDDDDARPTQPGDAYTYTLSVRNRGNAPAYDVRVSDQPDDDLVAVLPATGAGFVTDGWSAGDRDLEWVIPGPIAPGDTVTLSYTADLGPSSALTDGETVANTADVPEFFGVPAAQRATDGFDYRTYANVTADTVTLTVDLPQLVVDKTTGLPGDPDTGDAEIRQAFPWRIVVTNAASTAVARDVSLTDVLPAGWTVVPGSVTPAPTSSTGDTLTWTDVADLASGASTVITFSATPSEAAAANPDPQVNTATATASDASGAGGYTDSDTGSATLRSPTLELDKTPDAAVRPAGAATSWNVQIRNSGDGTARNVVIADTLPAGVTYAPGSATAAPAAGFSEVSANGTAVGWELASLAPGATVDITVPVTIDADLPAGTTLTNAAEAHADEASTPVTDTGSFILTTEADVRVEKVGDVPALDAGRTLTYTITATNDGPSDAQDVVVTDVLPAAVTFIDAEAPCTELGGTVTCALGRLPAGASRDLTLRVRIRPGTTGTVQNTASVATSTDDPDATNDEDTETTTIGALADLSLVKTAARPDVLQGGTVAFSLTVRNDGPSDATGVVVGDPLPAGASFVPAGSDPRCAEAGGVVECALGTLGESAAEELVVVLQLDAVGTTVNVANVFSPTPDPDTGDLSDDAEVEVAPATDLSVEKTGPATVDAGSVATYELTARNAGPSDATGVVLRDTLPAGTTFEGSTPAGVCTEAAGVVSCPVGDVASGAEQAVQLHVAVPPALGGQSLLNAAAVEGDQGDPDPSDNADTASTDVGPAVDLHVTKTTPGAVAGSDVTWTVAVVNRGPSPATGVTVEDPLPHGVAFVAAAPGQGTCALDGTTLRCDLGTLPAQGAAQVTITGRIGADRAGSELVNTATATAVEPEIEPADNAGTASVTVAAPVPDKVALELTKTASTKAPRLGEPFSYVIRARNTGAVDAPAAVVTDALAAPLDLVSVGVTQGSCTGDRVLRCELGTIPAGGEASVTLRVMPRRAGAVRNFASVDSAGVEQSQDTLGAVAGVTVGAGRTKLRLDKRALRSAVRAGGKVTFALAVRTGARAAQDVRVCDTLPPAMAVVSARGATLSKGRPCWRWSYLPAHAKRVVHITVRVAPGAVGAAVRNTAIARAANAARRRASDRVRVQAGAVRGGGVTG